MKIHHFRRVGVCTVLFSACAWAQVGAPSLGYLPNRGHILPISGIPASASAAAALNFNEEFIQIAVSPRQDFALVSSSSSGAVLIAYVGGTTFAIKGTSAYPDSIAMSPSGSAAILWFASSRSIEILSGLPSAPVVRRIDASFLSKTSSLGNTSSDVPSALSISDDGAWGAGAWPAGLWAFGPNGEVRSLPLSDAGFALAFFPGRQDLAIATGAGIFSISDVGGSATLSTLYIAPSRQIPAGLAISTNNQRLVMADRLGSILTLELGTAAGGQPAQVDCACEPEGVFPMGGSVFRITGLSGSAFRIFDPSAGSVFLVPLAPGAMSESSLPGRAVRQALGGSR